HGLGGTYRSIYLDNLLFEAMVNNDLLLSSFSTNGYANAGETHTCQIGVKNNGLLTQNSYTLKLMSVDNSIELASLLITTPLAPETTALHTISWIPSITGELQIYGNVSLTGDSNSGNNSSANKQLTIYPQTFYLPVAGDIQSTTTANTLPINFYWKNSISETIYLADELIVASGNIEGLIYSSNFVQELSSKPVKIWVKNTTETNLSTAWLPFENYTLVFDGMVDFSLGTNSVIIPFSAPFAYSGANLAVRVNRPMDTEYFSSSNHFYYTDFVATPNRSRYLYSDSTVYDPSAPSASGTLSSYIPVTAFVASNAALISPLVTVNNNGASLQLSWDAVPGAQSYKVYATENLNSWLEEPLAVVFTNSYSTTAASKRFFRVVASTVATP
ncbi:MAG: hypothetical protein PHO32_04860, partial [Candidatus Cloacimonetes bacterium]|nr:hypothetical protein [Candidatus Cloacimonadota bacterium]